MARIKNSMFKQLSGTLGDIIFYSRSGRIYARRRPQYIRDAKTPLQQQQRMRMRDVIAFYKVIKNSPLLPIWQQMGQEQGMSGMNLFIKMNIAAFAGEGRVTDYGKLHFSCGRLPQGDRFQACWKASESVIEVSWENKSILPLRRLSDRFMAVVVFENNELRFFTPPEGNYQRKDCHTRIVVQESHLSPYKIYCFFAANNSKAYSGDVCCLLKK